MTMFLLAVSMTLTAFAGGGGGMDSGGGNALVCFESREDLRKVNPITSQIPTQLLLRITRIEAIDLIESRERQTLLEPGALGFRDLLDVIARGADAVSVDALPTRRLGPVTGKWATLVDSGALPRIRDEEMQKFIPTGAPCTIVTLARQITQGGLTTVYIDKRLFDHPAHTELSKAVLMVHEYLYLWDRLANHATDSKATRTRVSLYLRRSQVSAVEFAQAGLL